ncbi:myo-inositol 2-dehydrogenase [Aureimonas sp. SA4125]|uniref:Gfo/Idh/MocA family protein n=1 Tax=Aureimonas sp. SA4125 TaxID=2826993 RepID=UPI001CC608AF|nr:Gfo/Idh/MocA family oxidoreductase [Aureimonas sp. SA4125]BDA83470.1 myo-inositol 2-dehydrogenase [Aureimonas sp. SA4125]
MRGIGVGLIGTGYMGKCHALAWNAVAATFGDVARPRLVMLAETSQALATARAAILGFDRGTDDWRRLVADPEVDIVSIAAPNPFHRDMAVTALEAGKHVWCEKPMATSLADAEAMRDAARASGRVAVLGYNYIQNPAIRLIGKLIAEGRLGRLQHLRVEMDEDFMADPATPFGFRDQSLSGIGALDDFGVHALSLLSVLAPPVERVVCDMSRPIPQREGDDGMRAVETHDSATVLLRFAGGATGQLALNRAAWGRKGRIALQIFGNAGSVTYDQERLNEVQYFDSRDPADRQGFRTLLAGPAHPPFANFVPAPGHSLGFNDLKVIEAREVLNAVAGKPARLIDFEAGLDIETCVAAMARSHANGVWVDIADRRRA